MAASTAAEASPVVIDCENRSLGSGDVHSRVVRPVSHPDDVVESIRQGNIGPDVERRPRKIEGIIEQILLGGVNHRQQTPHNDHQSTSETQNCIEMRVRHGTEISEGVGRRCNKLKPSIGP